MNDRATLQAELLLLCGKVRDDTLTPGDAARLDELLQADDSAKALYIRYMSVVSLLESRGMGQRVTNEEPERSETIDHNVFAELLEMEAQAEAELVEQAKPVHLFVPNEKTPWQIGGALRWVAQQPAFWSGAAAVFVIAVVLSFVLRGGDTTEPIASDNPNTPAESALPILRDHPGSTPVATLTAQHNAVWAPAGGASAPPANPSVGTNLHPNQRLTLTAGFAEITTARGAVAILEAPATVEFTHNDNAIELHAGKLVGICETDSSKGFVVRTPHMDITDLGTRFGVDATDTRTTEVHVFDGEVAVALADADETDEPTLLTAGESASTSSFADAVVKIEQQTEAFAELIPATVELPGTGQGLRAGQADPNWLIIAMDGRPLDKPVAMWVSNNLRHLATFPNDPQRAQWLAWRNPALEQKQRRFTLRTRVELPEEIDPLRCAIRLRYVVDNEINALRVNGSPVPVPQPRDTRLDGQDGQVQFDQQYEVTVPGDVLTEGVNTFELELTDYKTIVGLRLAWELYARPAWRGSAP